MTIPSQGNNLWAPGRATMLPRSGARTLGGDSGPQRTRVKDPHRTPGTPHRGERERSPRATLMTIPSPGNNLWTPGRATMLPRSEARPQGNGTPVPRRPVLRVPTVPRNALRGEA